MSTLGTHQSEKCTECGCVLDCSKDICTACGSQNPAPNVRRALSKKNRDLLQENYDKACETMQGTNCENAFHNYVNQVKSKSRVVIATDASTAHKLLESERSLYANYETLTQAGVIASAEYRNDLARHTASGAIFGGYASSIYYGALCLSEIGLPSYGCVHFSIKSNFIKKRTSFLVENSYPFVERYGHKDAHEHLWGNIAAWDDRGLLAGIKLAHLHQSGLNSALYEEYLCSGSSANRATDEFIEAHIFRTMSINSVDSIAFSISPNLGRLDTKMLDIVKELAEQRMLWKEDAA